VIQEATDMPANTRRIQAILEATAPVFRFLNESSWAHRHSEAGVCDFALGNPHELALPGFVQALQRWTLPRDKDWYAYKMSEPESQSVVAAGLRERRGISFEPQDIFMTNGGFGALAVALGAVVDVGDEVIFISPPWFFYEALIVSIGGRPVRVPVDRETYDLDLPAIAAAISPRTRAIIINSPNNPTGRIYPASTLKGLADILSTYSQRQGRPIFLLSDEAYSRIVYDDRACPSPTAYYPNSFLLYTYGKTLLTPGQRIGYIALPPEMPDREEIRPALTASQMCTGFAFPNALLQHALPDLEKISIDIPRLQARRDRMVGALRDMGFDVRVPEGTFYLLPRSPIADDWSFVELMARQDVFILPGSLVEMPGTFRLSLTASDEMVERALPLFEQAIRQLRSSQTASAAA
jgi:aspartate aminotransferase